MLNPSRCVARHVFLLGLCAWMLALAAGCQCNRLGRVPPDFRDSRESGIAVIGKAYSFSAQSMVQASDAVLFTLKSNEEVTTGGGSVRPDFRAYVRPPKGVTPADIHVNFTVPMIDILTGWMYLVGTSPMGKTTRVRAVGEGTRMIIEVDDSVQPAIHRVYLVGDVGSRVAIHVPDTDPTPAYTLKELGTYLEVYEDGQWKYKGAYSAVPERDAFVRAVLAEITGARVR